MADDSPTPTAQHALTGSGLTRRFGATMAVNGVSLALAPGEFLTIFGPNGAGKTTLLRILAGGLRPTEGEVRLAGERVDPNETEWRRGLGVLSHQSFLYGHLTAAENLRFFGRLFGLRDLATRVPERLEQVGLAERSHDTVRTFSRGMRQRLALARAMLHDPAVVLLDEPYTGLDAHAADVLRRVLSTLKDGRRTVVLVTHNLTQGLEMADRVAIQVRGRFVEELERDRIDIADFEHEYRRVVERSA